MSSEQERTKVCIISSWFPSKTHPHIAPFVYDFAKNLGKAGIDVTVITTANSNDSKISVEEHMTVHRINSAVSFIQMFILINRIKPDIIHIHAPNLFSSNAIIVAKFKRIPVIATVHRAEVDAVGGPLSLFRKLALGRFSKIVAVSEYTKSLAINAGALQDKIEVNYNSCDENVFYPRDKLGVRRKLDIPSDKKVVVFVGNLIKIKGVYTLVEAVKRMVNIYPDFLLLIVGKGEEREKLEDLVGQYKLEDVIKFVGWKPAADLAEYYAAADVFVLPSDVEGNSVALIEALATGLPIVASNVGGNPESVENGMNGFTFERGDADKLAQLLAQLLSDDSLRAEMSRHSIRVHAKKFAVRNQIGNYLRIYRSFIFAPVRTHDCNSVLLIDNQGLSHYTSYLASGLAKYAKVTLCGFSIDDYLITGAKDRGVQYTDLRKYLPKGDSILVAAMRPLLLFFPLFSMLTRKRPDVVHFQGHLPLFFLFIPLLRLRRTKIVWTLHDVYLRPSNSGLRGKLELLQVRLLVQASLLKRSADKIIVHGSFLNKALIAEGVCKDKIVVIPHFDYLYLLNSKMDGTSGEYVLLFGKIKPYKGLDTLITASRIVRSKTNDSLRILIAGKGNASYLQGLLTSDDRHYIHFRNEFIPHSEISTLFSKASFVVLPYNDGSQSGIIPLAYTFSKPVIVSDVGSIAEWVEHGKTGFVCEPQDATQLAHYMVKLIEDKDLCHEMGKLAHQKLINEMTLEKCCEVIVDIYKRN